MPVKPVITIQSWINLDQRKKDWGLVSSFNGLGPVSVSFPAIAAGVRTGRRTAQL